MRLPSPLVTVIVAYHLFPPAGQRAVWALLVATLLAAASLFGPRGA